MLQKIPERMKGKAIGFFGAGRVGGALLFHCLRSGYRISGIYDVNQRRLRNIARKLKVRTARKPEEVVLESDVLFFTVPDREITRVYQQVKSKIRPGTVLVHCAGAFGSELFAGAEELGLETLALHPVQTFVSDEQAVRSLPGSYFALDGSAAGLRFGRSLVRALRGRGVVIKGEYRPLYHALCVFSSNFLNALFYAAEQIGRKIDLAPADTRRILKPLARVTLENILNYGACASLTGPVRRADERTIRIHLRMLKRHLPEAVPVYRTLTSWLRQMLRAEEEKRRGEKKEG
ncbi:MAG: DUF2520 domain-containing protein [candidate division WOR-3 bacterium]|uniref:DUF2520 domain-containing protein n=1 Tax=candidate division WOR-3 bacterium TaxID=2052148 RepID=A0A7C1SQ30_UNCW3|nr:DUF2520 domain-containing protein [candidate division WOR-3 bacterium]